MEPDYPISQYGPRKPTKMSLWPLLIKPNRKTLRIEYRKPIGKLINFLWPKNNLDDSPDRNMFFLLYFGKLKENRGRLCQFIGMVPLINKDSVINSFFREIFLIRYITCVENKRSHAIKKRFYRINSSKGIKRTLLRAKSMSKSWVIKKLHIFNISRSISAFVVISVLIKFEYKN